MKASSDEYKKLCTAALDCIEEAEFANDAQKVFKSEAVRIALQSAVNTVIRALELIPRYYSKARERESPAIRDITLSYAPPSTHHYPDHRRR